MSTTTPDLHLTRHDVSGRRWPDGPRGLVLVLHGGTEQSVQPVDARSASWQRAAFLQRAIQGELARDGIASTLLRFTVRGWNRGAPVRDARAALDHLADEHPDVPIVLLGHSMGGRTAVHAADHPQVVGVVGLAPWLPPGEPVAALRGRRLVAGHGSMDRITSPRATRAYVERARLAGADAEFHDMGPVGHYMFRRAGRWNAFAAEHVKALLPH